MNSKRGLPQGVILPYHSSLLEISIFTRQVVQITTEGNKAP